jgi:hypothetical protein
MNSHQQQQAVLLAGQQSNKQCRTQQHLSQQQMHRGCLPRLLRLLGCMSSSLLRLLYMLQLQIQNGGTMTSSSSNSSSSSSAHRWAVLQATAVSLQQLLQQQRQHSASTVQQLQHQLLQALLHTKLYIQCPTNHPGISGQRQRLQRSVAAGMTGSSRSSQQAGAAGMQTCRSSKSRQRSFHWSNGQVRAGMTDTLAARIQE